MTRPFRRHLRKGQSQCLYERERQIEFMCGSRQKRPNTEGRKLRIAAKEGVEVASKERGVETEMAGREGGGSRGLEKEDSREAWLKGSLGQK